MKKLLVLLVLFLGACATKSVSPIVTEVPQVVVETETPVPTPTELPKINIDSFREYAEIVFTDIYGNCVGLSRNDWASTDFTISLLIRADAEACVKLISSHEIPLNCEYDTGCNQLSNLAKEYTALVTDGWGFFRKGEKTLNNDLVSKGLGMFWDADEMWLEIRDVVFVLEDKYGWNIH